MAELPNIDLPFGLSQLSGNQALYFKLLQQFATEYKDTEEKVQTSINANSINDATILLHTLKGVSANLGLNALSQQAKLVEQDLKQTQQLGEHYTSMLTCLQATLDEIDTLTTGSQNSPQAGNQRAAALTRLKNVVANMEFISATELDSLLNDSSLDSAVSNALREAVLALDYGKAKSILATQVA